MNSIERVNELIKEKHANWIGISNQVAIKEVLEELDKYKAELEKKDKIINLMAEYIEVFELDDEIAETKCRGLVENCKYSEDYSCTKCIVEYFEKKVGE